MKFYDFLKSAWWGQKFEKIEPEAVQGPKMNQGVPGDRSQLPPAIYPPRASGSGFADVGGSRENNLRCPLRGCVRKHFDGEQTRSATGQGMWGGRPRARGGIIFLMLVVSRGKELRRSMRG